MKGLPANPVMRREAAAANLYSVCLAHSRGEATQEDLSRAFEDLYAAWSASARPAKRGPEETKQIANEVASVFNRGTL